MKHISRQHGPKGLRKQIGDLTLNDLRETPIWEFATNEEGEPGQDEETLRPRPDLDTIDTSQGLFVVATTFSAVDGSQFSGYAQAKFTGVPPSPDDGFEQLTILVDDGCVDFWHGMVFGRTERAQLENEIAAGYRLLDISPERLFPLAWKMNVPVKGSPATGKVLGFGYLRRVRERGPNGTSESRWIIETRT